MIVTGTGLHNFAEGWHRQLGRQRGAVCRVARAGFCAAPGDGRLRDRGACGRRQRAAVLGGLALLGLIGGGPTFVGILVGQSA
jgi:ZIP family zinc transporter